MAKPVMKKLPKVERTSAGLRDTLFDELDRLRNGESNPTTANAVARLVDQVVNTVQMDLEVHKYLRDNANKPPVEGALLPAPLKLSERAA